MNVKRRAFEAMVVLLFSLMLFGGKAGAATSVSIQSCLIDSSNHGVVTVRAAGASSVSGTDGNYYLYALMPYESKISGESLLVGTVRQSGSILFRALLDKDSDSGILYRKFAVAVQNTVNDSFTIVSNVMYITNPEVLAKYHYVFPKAASKKGLHVQPEMLSDAEDLRVKHAAVNICLDTFLTSGNTQDSQTAYVYQYQGKT